jgi:uncharacterized peroxidase-related enzyme
MVPLPHILEFAMSRMHALKIEEATGQTAELFTNIKRNVGKLPNAYATIGSHAPDVLGHLLTTHKLLKEKTDLSMRELEAINLAVSEATGCDYCVASHTLTAKLNGYTVEQTLKLRAGAYDEDAKIDALAKFAVLMVKTSGTVPAEVVENLRGVGYSERQILESLLAISTIMFTNMVNRVNDTTLDFPKAP